jgi:hypothetical protein
MVGRLAALVGLVLAVPGWAGEPAVFIGFSAEQVAGDVGYAGMNAACRGDFGARARMCSSKEYIETPRAAAPPANAGGQLAAFVNPLIVAGGIDYSGQRRANCASWRSQLGRGLVVWQNGSLFDQGNCALASAVTCCRTAR